MGVGTFSIDEDTAKNLVSGRFVSKIKVKRCNLCKNCRKRNCKECVACKDMPKYGGEGKLKQSCIYRRCTNPTPKKNAFKDLKNSDIIEPIIPAEPEPVPMEQDSKIEEEDMEEEDLDDTNPLNSDPDALPRIPVPPRSMDRPKHSYR